MLVIQQRSKSSEAVFLDMTMSQKNSRASLEVPEGSSVGGPIRSMIDAGVASTTKAGNENEGESVSVLKEGTAYAEYVSR